MQTNLILTKGAASTVQIHILDNADIAFSLTSFISAEFTMKSTIDGDALIRKYYSPITTTTSTSEPMGLTIGTTYVEIDILESDTVNLDSGIYIADVAFTDASGKVFVTDIFYVELKPRIS
jgi:hypothetical protein